MKLVHGADPGRQLGKAGLIGAAVSGLLLLGLLAAPVPHAQAHDFCIGHPSDPSVICVRASHTRLDVCDRDVDGHKAYARVWYSSAVGNYFDGNGGQPDCGNHLNWNPHPLYGYPESVNICVETEGCGSPRYWYEF
jgi:hypothetical protein